LHLVFRFACAEKHLPGGCSVSHITQDFAAFVHEMNLELIFDWYFQIGGIDYSGLGLTDAEVSKIKFVVTDHREWRLE
jgi:hypothetical protein